MPPALARWSRHYAVASVVSLGGVLCEFYAPYPDTHPFLAQLNWLGWLAAPGLLASIFLGGSLHGGSWGDWRDYVLVPAISGVFWGTLTFVIANALRARRQRNQSHVA